jgi:hypothetical protein
MQSLLTAGLWLCLLCLPLQALAQDGAAVGHQNLRLGMTVAEALVAEPLAKPEVGCPPGTCLGYFDRRFLNTGYRVLADFGPNDSLHSIALSMQAAQGEAPCRRELQSAARDYDPPDRGSEKTAGGSRHRQGKAQPGQGRSGPAPATTTDARERMLRGVDMIWPMRSR